MMDLFTKDLDLLIKFKAGMEEMKEIKIPHPFQGRKGIFFLKDEDELRKNPPSRETFQKTHLHRIPHQILGMFSDLESKTLFKPDRPKDPSGIFDKREIMQNADRFFLDISYPPKKIDQLSERFWIELDRQGVHGKVSPIKVHLDRSAFHRGQGCRRII